MTFKQWTYFAYHHLLTTFAVIMATTTSQIEAAGNDTSIERLGPVFWPSNMDPYHKHSGHVLKREGSALYSELDLLNIPSSSTKHSDIYFNGTLYHYTSKGRNQVVDSSTIALMSCDGDHAEETFLHVAKQKPEAIILYTDEGNCCIFHSSYWQSMGTGQPLLFTFANMRAINPPDISSYELATTGTKVNVQYWAHFDATAPPTVSSYEPPISRAKDSQKGSTMLIVYIIVSLIAAGFLSVMLFLGVKACKRYGGEPVQHLRARQRQSRARGIARAALDALPVVKFGSKPVETVSKDVEMQDGASSLSTMGSTMEQRSEVGQQITAVPLPTERGHRLGSPISAERTNPPTGSPPTDTSLEVAEVPAVSEPGPNQVRCPVCLDDFEEEQEVRVLPCSHSFHTDCIDPWLLNIAGSCPLCRIDLRSPEERERDNVANVLTPPPPALTTRPRSLSVRSGRLQVLLDVARRNSSREERLAALRAVREEPGNARSPRNRRPDLGVSRLRRLAFGNARNGSGAVGENPSQRNGESIGGLVQGEAPHSAHSPASLIADLR